MVAYDLSVLDENGRIAERFAIHAVDDSAALTDAMAVGEGRAIELWNGDVLIAHTLHDGRRKRALWRTFIAWLRGGN